MLGFDHLAAGSMAAQGSNPKLVSPEPYPPSSNTQNLSIIWPLAPSNLKDASLDDVAEVSVSDRSIFTFPMIDCAKDRLGTPMILNPTNLP